ncbi:MAG: DUF167 domain-containing protein [Acidobacteria bacterium]|nr:DUF167 domain-containing protein [Acidobacteriota bacterium]
MSDFKIERDSLSLWLRVKPRARRDRLRVSPSGELVLELHAPPVEGEANEACVKFLAKAVSVAKSDVTILAGQKSRRKLLRISGRPGEEIKAQLVALVHDDAARRVS